MNLFGTKLTLDIVEKAIRQTEEHYAEVPIPEMTEEMKKQQSWEKLDFCINLINQLVDVPFISEGAEKLLIEFTLTTVVKVVVSVFNKYKLWEVQN